MKRFLYFIVDVIARFHSKILSLNDSFEYDFSDKELHFLIIGIIGMAMIFVVHPVFKWLVKRNHIMVISWIYVFTMILVLTFAIEIGQRVSHTGNMEFADIVYGLGGFLIMFAIFSAGRATYHVLRRMLRERLARREEAEDEREEEDFTGMAR